LINNASGNKMINLLDGNVGYNQIFMVEEDVSKTAFRCPGFVGLFSVTAGHILGFIVHEQGIQIAPKKVESISKIGDPTCKTDVQKVLGKINYLR
jgi:NAD/NADP transhydrogenase alpha subunit